MQTGIVVNDANETWCTVVPDRVIIEHSFLYATILFFFAPMMLISVLYLLIGIKLRSSTLIKRENGNVVRNNNVHSNTQSNTSQSTKRVIKMLGECFMEDLFLRRRLESVYLFVFEDILAIKIDNCSCVCTVVWWNSTHILFKQLLEHFRWFSKKIKAT
jgi:hypothetical protein